MHLANLEKEKRNKLYKIIKVDDIRVYISKNKLRKVCLGLLKKDVKKLTKKDLVEYVESCLMNNNEQDPPVKWLCEIVREKFNLKFRQLKDIEGLLKNQHFNMIDSETIDKLGKYRSKYNELDLPLDFDDFISLYCLPNDLTLLQIEIEKNNFLNSENQKNLDEIFRLDNENNSLKADVKRLKKDLQENQSITNKLKETTKKQEVYISKYENILSVDNLMVNLSDLIDISNINMDTMQIYDKLVNAETNAVVTKNYELVQKILAAKYALIKLEKEIK